MKTVSVPALIASMSILLLPHAFGQGALTPPPGPPAPTMKTLDQLDAKLEPRTPISSLPFTISQPGSYYLTGNLTGVSGQDGITIATSDVTLDLVGFALTGVAGSLKGVSISGGTSNIAVRNGTVRSWGGEGVDAGSASNGQFQDLRLSANGGFAGLIAGDGSTVSGCVARGNTRDGIFTGFGCTISGCTTRENLDAGIYAGQGSTVTGCTASRNTDRGIFTSGECTVSGCTANLNGGDGINASGGSTISGCTASDNHKNGIVSENGSTISGSTASYNYNDGIRVTSSCRVVENTCAGNGVDAFDGAGINALSSRNRIDSNNVMGNDRGIDCNPATANLIIRNSARGNTINYDIVAGNNAGAIIVSPGVGFSSSNAWANLEF